VPALPRSVPGVADVEILRGDLAEYGPPDLLVEVPHAADQPEDYAALRRLLKGALPQDLEHFFFVNTDVGALAVGRAVAEAVVAADPRRSALVLACRVPRTFVDCNRNLDAGPGGSLATGGLTPGLPPYITHPADQALLTERHRAYVALTDAACAAVLGAGGQALVPHSYAPRTVGIDQVDDQIVQKLHRVYAPGLADSWPLRPQVDLITRDAEGRRLCPDGAVEALLAAYGALGVEAVENGTYWLHPATRAATLSARYPGRLLCLELRRDLLVQAWTPFAPMACDPAAVARLSAPLVEFYLRALHGAPGKSGPRSAGAP
jgi:hypothetical protein